jgi:ketosteroid isomerase-like protein
MTPRTFAVALAILASGAPLSARLVAQSGSAEQALLQLERDWEQAIKKNDLAALERILAPEFVTTDTEGRFRTREQYMARRKSGQLTYTAYTQDDYSVRVIGDMALVTGRSTIKGTMDGKTRDGQERWTDRFVRRNGSWQAVASHSSRIATP